MTTYKKPFPYKKRAPKSIRIGRTILKYLLLTGAIAIAASSPSIGKYVLKAIFGHHTVNPQKFSNQFSYLKRKGLVVVEQGGHEVVVSLTPEGKRFAGKYQIDDLEILRPKKWDGKWRVIIFDIPHELRMIRNAFRSKLRELGFYGLQKSVWVCPFECRKEVDLLRKFFGLDASAIRIIEASQLEEDAALRRIFHI